jgi:hypothetical protein
MPAMRLVLAGLLATLAVVAGGCGGSQAAAGGDAAALLKPGALVYWETVSDPDSDQWEQVEELLRRFPDGDKWIRQLRAEFEKEAEGVTWPEVRAALGERTVVALYLESADSDPVVVGLMNPDDTEKTTDVIRRLNETEEDPDDRLVSRVVDGWVVVSDEETSIDAALAPDGERALGDEDSFTSALAELPEDALSRVYVDVATALERYRPELDEEERSVLDSLGLDGVDFAGAWAKAEDNGAGISALAKGSGLERVLGGTEPYASKLLERVPGDAFAFVTFRGDGITEQLERLQANALFRMGVREFEQELGVTVETLTRALEGEIALYLRPGVPIPEVTLLLDDEDPEPARAELENVLRAVAARGGGEVVEEGGIVTARFGGFGVHLGTADGAVVLSTSRLAVSRLDASGSKLPDSEAFKDALETAEAPEQYAGLAYVDLAKALELVVGFAEEELGPEVERNLEPLRSFVAWGTSDSDSAEARAFLGID